MKIIGAKIHNNSGRNGMQCVKDNIGGDQWDGNRNNSMAGWVVKG
ncbi:MAG: hypothetical protein SPI30_08015 [Prevotella sp.]|nr:hypothetical protein [Prevotella sp.]